MPTQRDSSLSFFQRINVVLSLLFMVVAVPTVLWLVTSLVSPGWRTLIFEPPQSWGILAISLVLGFSNASYYYKRLQSKLRK